MIREPWEGVFCAEFDRWAEDARKARLEMFRGLLHMTESPIERMLAAALIFIELPLDLNGDCRPTPIDPAIWSVDFPKFDKMLENGWSEPSAWLWAQAPVGGYRADFVLFVRADAKGKVFRFIIECDGHDFHERTKEQAQRDKSRDRKLSSHGFTVLRFTGSEVYRNARKCAKEVEGAVGAAVSADRFGRS